MGLSRNCQRGRFVGGENVFVGFLDFGEGVGDVIFVVDVFGTDFKGTSTAL